MPSQGYNNYQSDRFEFRRKAQKVFVSQGDVILRLHETDIVRVKANGDVVLSTGGWATHKTMTSMNDALELFGMWVEQQPGTDITRGRWQVRCSCRLWCVAVASCVPWWHTTCSVLSGGSVSRGHRLACAIRAAVWCSFAVSLCSQPMPKGASPSPGSHACVSDLQTTFCHSSLAWNLTPPVPQPTRVSLLRMSGDRLRRHCTPLHK
jgi:hypothetical protein